jgi:asparagine synthase (glutamine-hydrolysing)
LPVQIVERPKQGFELPLDEWFRDDLGLHFRALLLDGSLAIHGLFNRAYIEGIISAHRAYRANHGGRIWILANLGIWLNRFAVKV